MELEVRSKREHCPDCDAVAMENHVLMRPGRDVAIFVECAACGAFVARYTLKSYTCDDPYRSFLRLMRQRRMASGSLARDTAENFQEELLEEFRLAKEIAAAREETRDLEELMDDLDPTEEG
jgi:hypothetical protein